MLACGTQSWIRGGFCFWGLYCLVSVCGCTSESGEQRKPAKVDCPETFSAAGVNWIREQKLGSSDSRLLTHYFEANPSLADSPAFQGAPAVYHGTRNRRRFYWTQETCESPTWVCLQYDQGRFLFLEGTDCPW